MKDPMDKYSKPVSFKKTKLTKLYFLQPRKNPNKPGRELLVVYDDRLPVIKNFKNHYSYFVRFLEKENTAGNHYHKNKQELFIPIQGNFEVVLEDINTKTKEKIKLDAKDYAVLYVKNKIAHKVTAKDKNNVLLVLATNENSEEDEFHYEIN